MSGVLLLYTCAFVVYGAMEVLGLMPQELVSAGFTLPRLFSKYFGDPVSQYSTYLINRTSNSKPVAAHEIFVEFGLHDIPTEAHHHYNLGSSQPSSALLPRNVTGRTTSLCSELFIIVPWL